MISRFAAIAALAFAATATLTGSTITFGLGNDTHQVYTFTRTDTPVPGSEYPGMQITVNAGPYQGYLGDNVPADQGYFFCISFTKTSYWNTAYEGHIVDPSTPQQLEAAYLAAELTGLGGATADLMTYKGPISMAIWQIMDPAPHVVPRDPAAQVYVNQAQAAYNAGQLSSSMFLNSKIFVPDNKSSQSFLFMTAATNCPVPEPGPMVLMSCGALLLCFARRRNSGC